MKLRAHLSWLVIAVCIALSACRKSKDAHSHADEHPEGHDHHAEGHGHGETPMLRITRWTDKFELFAENAPAVAGREVVLLLHLTVLEGFRPLAESEVSLQLEGPTPITARAKFTRPGLFKLAFKAGSPGKYRGKLSVTGPVSGAIDDLELGVYADENAAKLAAHDESDAGLIEFLKEQQWGVPFGTAAVETGALMGSVQVAGTVSTPPGGSADVGAPVAGRLVPLPQGLPRPGELVRKGQALATLAPAPSSPEDAAKASLAVSEAQARAAAAQAALERAERLIKDQAISERELEDARREVAVASEAVRSAKRVEGLFSGATAGSGAGAWRLTAPIAGTIVEVKATPGATVASGELLFKIVDPKELWIRAKVPEQDAPKLRTDRDARFQVPGLEAWQPISITGPEPSASLVTVGRTVDATSRTVDVIYALHAPHPELRVGGMVQVAVPVGSDFQGVVIPKAANVNREGRDVVYVQVDGEHFVERAVKKATESAGLIGISEGLKSGERIVVRGAHLVRLADRSKASEAHGHIH